MQIKGLNRKGQEGLTLGTILAIVLGVVVLVVLIVGFTGGFGFIFSKFKILPGQGLESIVQSCKISADSSLKADYCATFKEVTINDVKQYVTCDFKTVNDLVESNNKGTLCTDLPNQDIRSIDFCLSGKLKGTDLSKILVNGQTCELLWFGSNGAQKCSESLHGVTVTPKETQCGAGELDITSMIKDKNSLSGKRCCIIKTSAK